MKCLVIGDTHFDNQYKGYLDSQIEACYKLIDEHKPKVVVFLGDIYHHRKPSPEVIVKVHKLFKRIAVIPGLSSIFVIRGNHDSANKSDDGLTALETLVHPTSKVRLIQQTLLDERFNFLFIPHYENEDVVRESLQYAKDKDTVVFGHFGYAGCINAGQYFDFEVEVDEFKNRTILGHIHKFSENGNVTILGTPWSTNFGECDYDHYVGVMEHSSSGWGPLNKFKVAYGPRHYVAPLEALDAMADEIQQDDYFTILRVLVDKFADDSTSILRSELLEKFNVGYVDLKFQPVYDRVLKNRLSNYDPNMPINNIDDNVIDRYIEEQASNIPLESLKKGLDLIKAHED
jgi:predicted phosphodiesterase